EAGQSSGFDIFVPNSVCCCVRRRQVGLDVVVVALNASAAYRGRDGSRDQYVRLESAKWAKPDIEPTSPDDRVWTQSCPQGIARLNVVGTVAIPALFRGDRP